MEPYQELEIKFAEFVGVDPTHMVLCSSGTAALHLALEAFRLPLGSRVLLPEFTMIACPRAVTLAGHFPWFIDCGERLLMQNTLVEDHLAQVPDGVQRGAIMAVHIYGRQHDMNSLVRIKSRQAPSWYVVEDLAEAHGVAPNSATDAACWSFYRNKIIHGEEGGAVCFKDRTHADLARKLRSMGFTDAHDFVHIPRGHNYRMSNAHARLILESLAAYPENTKRRRQVEHWYNELIPEEWRMPKRDAVWVYDIHLPKNVDTSSVVRELNSQGVGARLGFKPMSEQPEYRITENPAYDPTLRDSTAFRLSRRVMYLPVHPEMTQAQVEQIVEQLKKAVDRFL